MSAASDAAASAETRLHGGPADEVERGQPGLGARPRRRSAARGWRRSGSRRTRPSWRLADEDRARVAHAAGQLRAPALDREQQVLGRVSARRRPRLLERARRVSTAPRARSAAPTTPRRSAAGAALATRSTQPPRGPVVERHRHATQQASGSCSAWASISRATASGSAPRVGDARAARSGPRASRWRTRPTRPGSFASATYALPGPTMRSTRGTRLACRRPSRRSRPRRRARTPGPRPPAPPPRAPVRGQPVRRPEASRRSPRPPRPPSRAPRPSARCSGTRPGRPARRRRRGRAVRPPAHDDAGLRLHLGGLGSCAHGRVAMLRAARSSARGPGVQRLERRVPPLARHLERRQARRGRAPGRICRSARSPSRRTRAMMSRTAARFEALGRADLPGAPAGRRRASGAERRRGGPRYFRTPGLTASTSRCG